MPRENPDTRTVNWLIPWLLGLVATGVGAVIAVLWLIKGELAETNATVRVAVTRIDRVEEDRKDDRRRIDNLEALYFRQ